MVMDSIIVAVVVASAAAYLAWNLRPRRRAAAPAACAACASRAPETRQAVPVRTRWTA